MMKIVNRKKVYGDWLQEAGRFAMAQPNGDYTPLLTRFGRELLSNLDSHAETWTTIPGMGHEV